ncbi:MAG: sugar phosphate isomerase/epimerase [Oscillospiraceae bacterium]|jgi:sugar phosphate isomerase/epimerase|nr:sugar phosphate isomerase/epimerase [Oscillospiraceae bacterium]
MHFSIQLYTLRDMIHTGGDLLALLPQLKALGFDGVEFAGYYGLEAPALRRALEQAGLAATGAHLAPEDLRPKRLAGTLAFSRALGLTKIGLGTAPHGSPKETAKSCALLQAAAQEARRQGITVYYHNHIQEFLPFPDGSFAIEQFMAACMLQVDTYWSFCAGADNFRFLTEHKDRICSLHIKDGIGEATKALGEGACDLAAVLRAAKAIGMEWLVLENDTPAPDGLRDAARSMAWLRANA